MSGVELVPKGARGRLGPRHHHAPAIDEPRTAIECPSSGYDYLIKPVDLDELEMSLQAGCGSGSSRSTAASSSSGWHARSRLRTRDLESEPTVVEDIALAALAGRGRLAGGERTPREAG